jgi:cleavage stimulation factor subunit 3
MADLSPAHMQARTSFGNFKNISVRSSPSPAFVQFSTGLFLPSLPTFNTNERALVGAWKNYLEWEESNPLEIKDKDKPTLVTGIQSVYLKAVVRMRF